MTFVVIAFFSSIVIASDFTSSAKACVQRMSLLGHPNLTERNDLKTRQVVEEWSAFYDARLSAGARIDDIPFSKIDGPEKLFALTLALMRTEPTANLIDPKNPLTSSGFAPEKGWAGAEKAFSKSFSSKLFSSEGIVDRAAPLDRFADAILGSYQATHTVVGPSLWKTGIRERIDRQFLLSYVIPKLANRLTELGVFKWTPEEIEQFKRSSYRKTLTREMVREIPTAVAAGSMAAVGAFHGLFLLPLMMRSDFTNYLPVAEKVMSYINNGDLEGAQRTAREGLASVLPKTAGVANAVSSNVLIKTIRAGFLAAMLFKAYPFIELGYSVATTSRHEVVATFNANLDVSAAREEQYNEHVQDIIENENRKPTQAELEAYRKKLMAKPDSYFYLHDR